MKKIKVKVKDLHGKALVWAMTMLEGFDEEGATFTVNGLGIRVFCLEDLIERYKIGVWPSEAREFQWAAKPAPPIFNIPLVYYGGTPINAVIRCILAHHVGKEVEVPEELL